MHSDPIGAVVSCHHGVWSHCLDLEMRMRRRDMGHGGLHRLPYETRPVWRSESRDTFAQGSEDWAYCDDSEVSLFQKRVGRRANLTNNDALDKRQYINQIKTANIVVFLKFLLHFFEVFTMSSRTRPLSKKRLIRNPSKSIFQRRLGLVQKVW